MPLPPSFTSAGFVLPSQLPHKRRRRIMIGVDGPPDSGKTEFCLSAPGPGLAFGLDRGLTSLFDNPTPPPTRNPNWGFKVFDIPMAGQGTHQVYKDAWVALYKDYLNACLNADCRSILLDGDTLSYAIQKLAIFGRDRQIPQMEYDKLKTERKAFYAKVYDAGKIFLTTSTVKQNYVDQFNPDGTKMLTDAGNPVRKWDGTYTRDGYPDQDYLFAIQTRHMYDKDKGIFGLRILKCKPNLSLIGQELWGDDCCFAGLVSFTMPHIPLSEWGL